VLFLGNIPWSTTQDDLQEIFSEYGPICRVALGTSTNPRLVCLNSHALTHSPQAKPVKASPRGTPT